MQAVYTDWTAATSGKTALLYLFIYISPHREIPKMLLLIKCKHPDSYNALGYLHKSNKIKSFHTLARF